MDVDIVGKRTLVVDGGRHFIGYAPLVIDKETNMVGAWKEIHCRHPGIRIWMSVNYESIESLLIADGNYTDSRSMG